MNDPLIQEEWLLTDGIGGYASSTALGYNTRRYHGLWVAATRPPLGRIVILNQLEAHLVAPPLREPRGPSASSRFSSQDLVRGRGRSEGPTDVYFSASQYVDEENPPNCLGPKSFQAFPFPLLTYAADGFELSVEVFLRRGGAGVVVSYEVRREKTGFRVSGLGSGNCDRYPLTPNPQPLTPNPKPLTPNPSSLSAIRYPLKHWHLEIRPLLALRPFHQLAHEHGDFHVDLIAKSGFHIVSAAAGPLAAVPGVYLWCELESEKGAKAQRHKGTEAQSLSAKRYPLSATRYQCEARPAPTWYRDILYRKERERGFDHNEDLLATGVFEIHGSGPARFHIFCSLSAPAAVDVEAQKQAEVARQERIIKSANIVQMTRASAGAAMALSRRRKPQTGARIRTLITSADAFLVTRESAGRPLTTIIAGYHWFGDWGRDAMIALPGLTLTTRRFDVARQIFQTFASAVNEGMIPNNFSEGTGEPEYNSVDASLWFIQAAWAYFEATADTEFLRKHIWPVAAEIVEAYAGGTRFGIGADADGLIAAGDENTQLTWMDARVQGKPVTPRHGKAVEVNALWYNALCIVGELAAKLNCAPPAVCKKAKSIRRAFEKAFWNKKKGCLYDCIGPDGKADDAVRPNQIFAVSLPFAPLSGPKAASVVKVVQEKLYTPFGLRTLAPNEPGYCPRYEGGPAERDAAYHQGTVWPWLLGPFIEAYLKVNGFSDKVRDEAQRMLDAALETLHTAGLNFISEIFDAEPPHKPRGCIAQAWSVAELLRAYELTELADR